MKALGPSLAVLLALVAIEVAWGGHEFPVYPSYYPHEIRVQAIARERAGDLLQQGKIQAYVGPGLDFAKASPDVVQAVESLGSFVVVRVNPDSPLGKDDPSACAVAGLVARNLEGRGTELRFHPYPVTPFHGDFILHADLADAARKRLLAELGPVPPLPARGLRVRATGTLAKSLVRPAWRAEAGEWDAAIEELHVADLVAASSFALNGWIAPRAVRTGWFQAALVLGDSVAEPRLRERVQSDLRRLETVDYASAVERINLERELVVSLASSCRAMIVGYTIKREYVNSEYSAGIENIGYDSLAGLDSPMFIRTAKLKDFPWNGWLTLATDAEPSAAWNPIAGFGDRFGRLMWAAMGDPALLPSPNDEGWMLNRIADVQAGSGR